jgi:hypothetical protein
VLRRCKRYNPDVIIQGQAAETPFGLPEHALDVAAWLVPINNDHARRTSG